MCTQMVLRCCAYCILMLMFSNQGGCYLGFSQSPSNCVVKEGKICKLSCIQRESRTRVTWIHQLNDKKEIVSSSSLFRIGGKYDEVLSITVIHSNTTGLYYCLLSHKNQEIASRSAHVLVNATSTKIETEEKTQNDLLMFHCTSKQLSGYDYVWYKDFEVLPDYHTYQLLIPALSPRNNGLYTCTYENDGRIFFGKSSFLEVLSPPTSSTPHDLSISVNVGEEAKLVCPISSYPPPLITWKKKSQEETSFSRWFMRDGALYIYDIEEADAGIYVCSGINDESRKPVSVYFHLNVTNSKPYLIEPQDTEVKIGDKATLYCRPKKFATAHITWSISSPQYPLKFVEQDQVLGRISVDKYGTLEIIDVHKTDMGSYTCEVLLMESHYKKGVQLTVISEIFQPPPVIVRGPFPHHISPGGIISLPCVATSTSELNIRWQLSGQFLDLTQNDRIKVTAKGTLIIEDARESDSGTYICVAVSASGKNNCSAYIRVVDGGLQHSPDESQMPPAPFRPYLLQATRDSLNIAWTHNFHHHQTVKYQIEMFRIPSQKQIWEVVSKNISEKNHLVTNLQSKSEYVFLVRGINEFGVSPASPTSLRFITQGATEYDISNKELVIDKIVIVFLGAEMYNRSSFVVSWNVMNNAELLEGFVVKYWRLRKAHSKNEVYIPSKSQRHFYLTSLLPYNDYVVSVRGFSERYFTRSTEEIAFLVPASAPHIAPSGVKAIYGKHGVIKVEWNRLAKYRYAKIQGYRVIIYSQQNEDIVLNNTYGSNVSSITLHLIPLQKLMLQIGAMSDAGIGVLSEPIHIVAPLSGGSDFGTFPWLLERPWIMAGIGAVIWFILAAIVCMLWKRQKSVTIKNVKSIQHELVATPSSKWQMEIPTVAWHSHSRDLPGAVSQNAKQSNINFGRPVMYHPCHPHHYPRNSNQSLSKNPSLYIDVKQHQKPQSGKMMYTAPTSPNNPDGNQYTEIASNSSTIASPVIYPRCPVPGGGDHVYNELEAGHHSGESSCDEVGSLSAAASVVYDVYDNAASNSRVCLRSIDGSPHFSDQ